MADYAAYVYYTNAVDYYCRIGRGQVSMKYICRIHIEYSGEPLEILEMRLRDLIQNVLSTNYHCESDAFCLSNA